MNEAVQSFEPATLVFSDLDSGSLTLVLTGVRGLYLMVFFFFFFFYKAMTTERIFAFKQG